MTIDIATYEGTPNKNFVQDYALTKGKNDLARSIAMCAAITFVPAIVCAYWVGEATGFPPEVINSIKNLIDFYGYTKIDGKPDGAPL